MAVFQPQHQTGDNESGNRNQRRNPRHCLQTGSVCDDRSTKQGAERISKIKGSDIETRREALARPFSFRQDPHLERRHRRNGGGAEQADESDDGYPAVNGESHQAEHRRQDEKAAQHSRDEPPIGEFASDEIASDQSAAEHEQDRRDRALRKASNLSENRSK